MTVDRTALGIWFQSLPEGWSAKRLKHLGRLKGGSGFPVQLQGDTESELAFYKVGDLAKSKDGVYLSDPAHTITSPQAKSLGARVFEEGSLVWAKIGAALLLNRRRIVSRPCCIDNNMTGFVPESAVADPKFCYYLTSAIDFSPHVKPGAVPSYSEGDQAELSVPLPPLDLQRAIAATLDRETARIDALIEKKTRFIELLKEKRQALITQAVTKGLDPTVPMKDSRVEWIGEVPAHWDTTYAKRIFSERDERSKTGNEELLTVSHLTGVTPRSEKNVNMFEAETTVGYKICRAGDLVINTLWAWMGAMGIARQTGIVSPAYNIYTPSRRLFPEFVDLIVRLPIFAAEVTRFSKGVWSSRLRLYPEAFYEVLFAVPPITEQKIIVSEVGKHLNRIEKLTTVSERSIELLKERRSALITAAVTGQIDLREDAA